MPTYAYACKSCGHRFDAVQSFSEPSLTECPECGGTLRKEYGSIGVTFNGSGFYRTDSRAGGEKKADAAGSGGSGSGGSESGGSGSGGSGSGGSGSGSGGDAGASGGGSSPSSTGSKSEAKASPSSAGT